jgi:2-methylcitrate dehydratase PrpD
VTTTLRMAHFAAEEPVAEQAIDAAAACHGAFPAASPEGEPVGDTAFWVTGAVLWHAAARDAGRRQTEPALAAGLEVSLRLLAALDGHVVGGWDPVSAAVVVGAAAGAARASGLGTEATVRAIGIAATQASGLSAVASSPLGRFQRRNAARNGVQATDLARAGLTAPTAGLEGRRGLFALIAPTADPAAAVAGLGGTLLVTERWPASGPTEPSAAERHWAAALRYAGELLS